jgi:hypothetical protein
MDSEIITLLDATHAALLDGDLDAIGALAAQLDGLLGTLGAISGETLSLIRTKAVRNAAVLRAAEQGVRAAQRRLAELREAASGHRTYGRDGHRMAVSGPKGVLRQRV